MTSSVDRAGAEWIAVGRSVDVPKGTVVGFRVGDEDVIVANLGERFVALSAECTHAGCPLGDGELDAVQGQLVCWCHGSTYDVTTGQPIGGPAEYPLSLYRVRDDRGELQVALPAMSAPVDFDASARRT